MKKQIKLKFNEMRYNPIYNHTEIMEKLYKTVCQSKEVMEAGEAAGRFKTTDGITINTVFETQKSIFLQQYPDRIFEAGNTYTLDADLAEKILKEPNNQPRVVYNSTQQIKLETIEIRNFDGSKTIKLNDEHLKLTVYPVEMVA